MSESRPFLGWMVVCLLAASGGLVVYLHLGGGGFGEDLGIFVAIFLTGLIGAFLVGKRPSHPVSWLLVGAALTGTLAGISSGMEPSIPAVQVDPLAMAAIYLGAPTWFAFIFIVLGAIPLLFPTGKPPSARWKWVLWVGIPLYLGYVVLWVVQEQFCHPETLLCIGNPIGVSGVTNPEEGPLLWLIFACLLGAVASMVVRFRRSSGVERQQLKALVLTVGLFISAVLVIDLVGTEILGFTEPDWFNLVWGILWVAIPVSIAVAILRYRLYEIDRIVSRTVSYALVAGLLGAVFAGIAIGLPRSIDLPEDNTLLIAAATLVVAALFNPLRRRVQEAVDRRFNRSRYDAERIVEAFAVRLRDQVDLSELHDEILAVVSRSLEPAAVSLWLGPPREQP